MKILTRYAVLLCVLLTCYSCEDTMEPGGVETRVFGRFYDSDNNMPLANRTLRIGEYNHKPSGGVVPNYEFIGYVGTTTTDENGYYDVTFTTTGQGDTYRLEFGYNDDDHFHFFENTNNHVIEDLGQDVEVNFDMLFLFPVNLKVTLDPDVEMLPVRIQYPHSVSNALQETGVQVERLYYIDKNTDWLVMFSRATPEGQERVTIEMPATNTTELQEFEFYLNDDDFELY